MWVRNPYSRLLSAFLDKGVNTPGEKSWQDKVKRLGGPYYDSPQEFHRFLRNIVDVWEEGEALDYHFKPQSRLCGLPQGVRYDFYLKVEDMAVWFADLVSLLGLEDAVATGWGADYKKVVQLLLCKPTALSALATLSYVYLENLNGRAPHS
jgi:hypothetical protein